MNTISHPKRYLPHDLNTKYFSVLLYRSTNDLNHVLRCFKISKASLMRWNKLFDGSKSSLLNKPHTPKSPHPNAHTYEEIRNIKNLIRRNPNISMCELYGKLRCYKGYSRHASSLFRLLRKLGFYSLKQSKYVKYIPKKYHTPNQIGIKWQLDVKFVPKNCFSGLLPQKFYQYTIIDEASRERFIYPYKELSSYSSVDFIRRAIIYFGYKPKIIQTDNGTEFTHITNTSRVHPLDVICHNLHITHKLIRPRTPRHNGKVERSHRNDNERFYKHLKFFSYDDLLIQMKSYLKRSNNIPMSTLSWLSPLQKRHQLLNHVIS